MGFEFTSEDLAQAGASNEFNGGKAGKVLNCTVKMEKAGEDGVPANTNPNAPTFKLWVEDSNGARSNRACFSIKEEDYPDSYGNTYEKTIKKEWSYLNKIVEHTGGTPVMSFSDDTDLFTKIKAAIGTDKVNVFANYGTVNSPKEYLEPRKWLPAVEPAGTPDSESKLVAGRLDQMEKIGSDSKAKVEQKFF